MINKALPTAGTAILLKGLEVTADAMFYGTGLAVRVAKIIVDLHGALKSYDEGQGILFNVPVANLPGGDFSVNMRVNILAKEPPPGLPADLAIDYVSTDGRLDKFNAVEGAKAAPVNDAPPQADDLGPLLRHAERPSERRADHHQFGSSTPYLHQPSQTGWIVIQPPGEPARCEAWFTYQLDLSLPRPTESDATCPRCGKVRPSQHDCDTSTDL